MKRKFIIFILIAAMVLPNVVFAANNIADKIDFSGGMSGFQSAEFADVTDGGEGHGNVLRIKANPDKNQAAVFSGKKFETDFTHAIISFDFMVKDNNSQFYILWQSTGDKVASRFFLETDGTMYISNDKVSSDKIHYDSDRWYSVDVVMDFENRNMIWILDGEQIFKDAMCGKTEAGSTFKWFYAGVTQKGKTGEMYIDNIYIRNYGLNSAFGLCDDECQISDTSVKLCFDERIDKDSLNNLKNLELKNTVTGNEIEIKSTETNGYNINLELEEPLKHNTEYALIGAENLKSITGKALENDILYFMIDGETAAVPEFGNVLDEINFENGELNTENITFSSSNNALYEIVEDEENKALQFTASGREDGVKTAIGFSVSGDSADKSGILVGYDVKLLQEDVLSFATKISDTRKSQIYNAMFNAKNKFMSFNYPNLAPDYKTSMNSLSSRYAVTADISKDKWHKIILKFDRDNLSQNNHGITTVYMDGEQIGSFATAASSFNGIIGQLKFEDFAQQNAADSSGQQIKWGSLPGAAMLIDNIKIGYPKSTNTIKKVRFADKDGKSYGPLTKNLSAMATGAVIYFNADLDVNSVNESTLCIVSESGENVEYTISDYDSASHILYIDFCRLLDKSMRYTLKTNGIKTNNGQDVNDYQTTFSTSEQAEFLIDNFRIENQSGRRIENMTDTAENDEISLCADFYNSTDEDKNLYLILCRKKDYTMQNCELINITIPSGSKKEIKRNELKMLLTDTDADEIDSYICTGELSCIDRIKIGQSGTYTKDDYSVSFDDELLADTMIFVLKDGTQTNNINKSTLFWADYLNKGTCLLFKMPHDALSGKYSVHNTTSEKTYKYDFDYININTSRSIISEIKTAAENNDSETLNNLIQNNKNDLQLTMPFVNEINMNKMIDVLIEYIKGNSGFGSDVHEDIKNICKCAVLEGVAEKKVNNLFEYYDMLGLNKNRLKSIFNKDFVTEDFQKNVTAALQGKNYNTYSAFENALYEAFVVQTFNNSDGIDNCFLVINEFYREIGLNSSACTNESVRNAMNKNLNSYQAIYSALTATKGTSGKTSPGGGGIVSVKNDGIVNETKPAIPQNIYTDLSEAEWAADAIVKLTELGIVHGKGENEFKPNENITREEFVTLVVNAFANNAAQHEILYSDVKKDSWFYTYISKAVSAGLIYGISNDKFGVGENITRQDMAVIIKRCADYYGIMLDETSTAEGYSDYDSVSDYAKREMYILAANGIINGIDGMYAPHQNATRAQAAMLIYILIMNN